MVLPCFTSMFYVTLSSLAQRKNMNENWWASWYSSSLVILSNAIFINVLMFLRNGLCKCYTRIHSILGKKTSIINCVNISIIIEPIICQCTTSYILND